jgi:hypothetical protein
MSISHTEVLINFLSCEVKTFVLLVGYKDWSRYKYFKTSWKINFKHSSIVMTMIVQDFSLEMSRTTKRGELETAKIEHVVLSSKFTRVNQTFHHIRLQCISTSLVFVFVVFCESKPQIFGRPHKNYPPKLWVTIIFK